MNSNIRQRKRFLEQQAKWEEKSNSVVKALFTDIRGRMKNKKASIVKENALKPTDLTLIMENENETSNSVIDVDGSDKDE